MWNLQHMGSKWFWKGVIQFVTPMGKAQVYHPSIGITILWNYDNNLHIFGLSRLILMQLGISYHEICDIFEDKGFNLYVMQYPDVMKTHHKINISPSLLN